MRKAFLAVEDICIMDWGLVLQLRTYVLFPITLFYSLQVEDIKLNWALSLTNKQNEDHIILYNNHTHLMIL